MSQQTPFDPSKYLTKVGSSDYLEVKWRLVWLREVSPDASIDTELVSHDGQMAVFRARVALPGGGSATGWGSEAVDDFRDYLEKAETKALGRALAALGFGTQFCPDFEFGAAAGKIVDAPIDFASTRGRRATEASAGNARRVAQVGQAATPRQLKFMEAVAREAGLTEEQLKEEVQLTYGVAAHGLSRRDASAFIEKLQNRRASLDLAS
ncbi:MAG: hypothetical protein ACJ789_18600 [Thermomicrobiales bacterium]